MRRVGGGEVRCVAGAEEGALGPALGFEDAVAEAVRVPGPAEVIRIFGEPYGIASKEEVSARILGIGLG